MTKPASMSYRERIEHALGERDPLDVLKATSGQLRRILRQTSSEILQARPLPGKWTPCEVIGHLVDAELVITIRMRLILTENSPALPNWQQDAWVAYQRYNDAEPVTLIEDFERLRGRNLPVWRSLTPAELARAGTHPARGRETLGNMLRLTAGHDLLHLDQMRRSIEAASNE